NVTEPADWQSKPAQWESSDNSIATVDKGFIVGQSTGKAVISVQYGGQKAELVFDNTANVP
ncbi:MAG: hypothetical protein ACM3PE_01110, partial [Deltaproteobacteria bacterium]